MSELSLHDYRALLRDCGIPSSAQIETFVSYVSTKHSWYKHLSLTPPGVRFCFFLDPQAGMQLFEDPDGRIRLTEIHPEDLFHYSMLTTANYRKRFGTLAVRDQGAPTFAIQGQGGTALHAASPGICLDGQMRCIPSEVAFVGTVMVTGVIHDRSSRALLWHDHLADTSENRIEQQNLSWPEESGGSEILERIRLCLVKSRGPEATAAIENLIAPERRRQRERMARQISRMIDVVMSR